MSEEDRVAPTLPARGILGVPGQLPFRVRRFAAPPDLAWAIDRFWVSSWDVPGDTTVTARVLPHATVNLTLEQDELIVTGVASGVFTRTLRGTDSAFGVKLTPGTFHLLSPATPVRGLDGEGQPALDVLPGAAALSRALVQAADDDARAAATADWLRASGVRPDADWQTVRAAHDALVGDPSVYRVEQVAERVGLSMRTIQRLFGEYLGVTPGWVLRRGRLHVAAERVIQLAARPERHEGWADVAAEFGYADQAHFTHDFRKVLGMSPGAWTAELTR